MCNTREIIINNSSDIQQQYHKLTLLKNEYENTKYLIEHRIKLICVKIANEKLNLEDSITIDYFNIEVDDYANSISIQTLDLPFTLKFLEELSKYIKVEDFDIIGVNEIKFDIGMYQKVGEKNE